MHEMRNPTEDELYQLRAQAGWDGDDDLVELCERALWLEDRKALSRCAAVIAMNAVINESIDTALFQTAMIRGALQ